jgi:hypothetical protein
MTQIQASSIRAASGPTGERTRPFPPTDVRWDDRPAGELDDEADRDELRHRYYGLLQELRVLLPGVQILVAFLLTAPFATGFSGLDEIGRTLYGVALVSGMLAVVAFTAPTVFHRVAPRRSRSKRLAWGIRVTRVGLVLLGTSLLAALAVVARVVFAAQVAALVVVVVGAAMVAMWLVLPRLAGRQHDGAPGPSPADERSAEVTDR